LLAGEQRYVRFILLTTALILIAMLANTFFIYWNLRLKFPYWLAEFEHWAQAKEEALRKLTNLLTTFSSWRDLGIAIIGIGIIPAIGEELVFRGILQSMLARHTNHTHVAIWVSAFIFSAIHLQIYGFLPRFLLGALFGYLYAWTQNLAYPILAHFLNNSLTLIVLFMQQRAPQSFSEEQQLLPIPLLITSTLIGILLIIHIYKQTRYLHHHPTSPLNHS
jgi:membrane protease YdiL (CAAX protease family)